MMDGDSSDGVIGSQAPFAWVEQLVPPTGPQSSDSDGPELCGAVGTGNLLSEPLGRKLPADRRHNGFTCPNPPEDSSCVFISQWSYIYKELRRHFWDDVPILLLSGVAQLQFNDRFITGL